VTLPVRALFAAPTVAGWPPRWTPRGRAAGRTRRRRRSRWSAAYPPGVYPLSFAQQRLWMLMKLGAGAAYNIVDALRFTGPLDDRALEHALTEMVRRHEPLRSSFELRDDEPVQVVQPARPPAPARAGGGRPGGRGARRGVREAGRRRGAPRRSPPRAPSSARACCARTTTTTPCSGPCTTWRATGGRRASSARAAGALRRLRADEGSPLAELPTTYGATRSASARSCTPARWSGWPRGGRSGWPAPPSCWSSPPTARARPSRAGWAPSSSSPWPEGTARRGGGVRPRARRHAVHGAPGRLPGGAGALGGAGRGGGGHARGQPRAGRAGAADRLLRQHAGAARRPVGRPHLHALVGRVREMALGAYEHQELPFERWWTSWARSGR
jgi:hypothetical protein